MNLPFAFGPARPRRLGVVPALVAAILLPSPLHAQDANEPGPPIIEPVAGVDLESLYFDPHIRLEGITAGEVEGYARWLELNETQRDILELLFADYRTQIDRLTPRARAYLGSIPAPFEPGYEEAVRERHPEGRNLRWEQARLDAEFLEAVEDILREEQRPLMARVWLGRQRDLWRVGREQLPGANVNLFALVEELDLEPEENEEVVAVLMEAEPAILRAMRETHRALARYWPTFHEAMALKREAIPAAEAEGRWNEVRDLLHEMEQLKKKRLRVGVSSRHRLLAENKRLLQRLREVLPRHAETAVRSRFLEAAYPEVYPDPGSAALLFEVALELDDLTADQAAALEARRDRWRRTHARLSVEMAEVMFRRRDSTIENAPDGTLMELGREREALNARQIELVRPVLTPAQRERLPEWDFQTSPPPRPWDPKEDRPADRRRGG